MPGTIGAQPPMDNFESFFRFITSLPEGEEREKKFQEWQRERDCFLRRYRCPHANKSVVEKKEGRTTFLCPDCGRQWSEELVVRSIELNVYEHYVNYLLPYS